MIVCANFKTNHTRGKTKEYLTTLQSHIQNCKSQVMVFPAASSLLSWEGSVCIGAQNAYAATDGAFTGEIGSLHLDEFGIKTILIGHSERRHILKESQKQIQEKFDFYKKREFVIVYCVGEDLDVKQQGEDAVVAYIKAQLEGIDTTYENLIVAYEPVWAIGTGLTPTVEEIEQIHTKLKGILNNKPLLYGGSVKVGNAQAIMSCNNVDGVLVGSGALVVEDFIQMVNTAEKIKGE